MVKYTNFAVAGFRRLAVESREWKCYKCGLADDLLPELRPKDSSGGASSTYADQIRELHKLKAKTAEEIAAESPAAPGADAAAARGGGDPGTAGDAASGNHTAGGAAAEATASAESSGERGGAAGGGAVTTAGAPSSPRLRSVGGAPAEGGGDSTTAPPDNDDACTGPRAGGAGSGEQQEAAGVADSPDREDDLLSFFAVAIALAIVGILIRKIYRVVA